MSCPRPNPRAELRLWCLPFAGGGAAIWHPWPGALGPRFEVVAFRLPARESRLAEASIDDPAALVDALVRELLPHVSEDYALLGHSLGGLLAYAMTRELLRRGAPPPQALVLSGIRAAHMPRTEPDLHALPDAELIEQLDARYGGIPPELRENPDLIDLFLPALRADLRVYETFPLIRPVPLDVPILALGAENDPVVTREQILGWHQHTTSFATRFFPGGHFFLQAEQRAVAAVVRDFLANIRRPAGTCSGGL